MKDHCSPDKKTSKELNERVIGALQFSLRTHILKYRTALDEINEIFKKADFKFSKNTLYFTTGKGSGKEKTAIRTPTFIDNEGDEMPVSTLQSRIEMKKYDMFDSDDRNILSANANKLTQAFVELNNKIGVEAVDKLMRRWISACDNRVDFIEKFGDVTSDLNGFYESKIDKNAMFYITNDPLKLILKSTARTWETQNCERIYGSSQFGIDSDISHNASIAYLMDKRRKGFESAVARLEMKVCEFNAKAKKLKDRFSIGLEINWYRGNHSHKRYHIFRKDPMYPLKINANEATAELVEIIKSRGYKMDYETCVTPYFYDGWSDIEYGKGNIRFQSEWPYRCERCGTPVRSDIGEAESWNHLCPYHNAHPDALDIVYDDDDI